MATENERLSLLGLFPTPDGLVFDQADIQQFVVYRSPLISLIAGVMPDLNGKNVLLMSSTIKYILVNNTKHFNLIKG